MWADLCVLMFVMAHARAHDHASLASALSVNRIVTNVGIWAVGALINMVTCDNRYINVFAFECDCLMQLGLNGLCR